MYPQRGAKGRHPGAHGPRDAWNVQPIHLAGGQDYNFILREREYGGGAVARMRWYAYGDMGEFIDYAAVPGDHLTTLIDDRERATTSSP